MKKLVTVLVAIAIFCCAQNTNAQKKDARTIYKAKADQDYVLFKFRSAAELYKQADTTNLEVIQKLAQCYKAIKEYRNAEHWFAKQAATPGQLPQFYLDYAEILANNGSYLKSASLYKKYLESNPKDRRALNLSRTVEQLEAFQKDSLNWNITFPTFNTPKDEFSPVYFKKGLIFTSNRDDKWGVKTMFGWNMTAFTDLYILNDTATIKYLKPDDYFNNKELFKLSKARELELPKTINDNKVLGDVTYPITLAFLELRNDSTPVEVLGKSINTKLHDGPMSFTEDQKTFFFNRNHVKLSDEGNKKIGIYKLNMWSGKYVDGKWEDVKPFKYNNTEYSTAHPALTPDGNILYFVSDMPGGFGGKDLYYCLRNGDSWDQPINMGPEINTEGDETFPYVAENGDFYFSSNGHTGLGGLDIFKVKLLNSKPVSAITNLGYPVNSSKDDFGIIVNNQNYSGFFSSNRYGSDDIFKFNYTLIEVKLKGKVTVVSASGNKAPVSNATVSLYINGIKHTVQTNDAGDYAYDLSLNQDYSVGASKTGMISPEPAALTTKGIKKSTTLIQDIVLTEPPVVVAAPAPVVPEKPKPLDCEEIKRIFTLENIYYDLDKYNIRNDAVPAMTRLISLMKQYPEIVLMIASHTDSRASNAYNQVLSNNRSKSVIKYLIAHGIDAKRISSQYFGERRPVNGCVDGVDCDEVNQQLNRRTEFYLFVNGKNLTIDCGL